MLEESNAKLGFPGTYEIKVFYGNLQSDNGNNALSNAWHRHAASSAASRENDATGRPRSPAEVAFNQV